MLDECFDSAIHQYYSILQATLTCFFVLKKGGTGVALLTSESEGVMTLSKENSFGTVQPALCRYKLDADDAANDDGSWTTI
jgi:hypothetical protein